MISAPDCGKLRGKRPIEKRQVTLSSDTGAVAPSLLPAVRLACDSDQLDQLISTDFVRTYADLITSSGQLDTLQRQHPASTIELINRGLGDPLGLANLYDVEPGALSPRSAAELVAAAHQRGDQWQVVYSDQNDLPAVIDAMRGLSFWHWIATPGRIRVPGHEFAQAQFAFADVLGAHLDLTLIWDPRYRPSPGAMSRALPAAAAAAPDVSRETMPARADVSRETMAAPGPGIYHPAAEMREVRPLPATLHAGVNHSRGVLDAALSDLRTVEGALQRHSDLLAELVPELGRFL